MKPRRVFLTLLAVSLLTLTSTVFLLVNAQQTGTGEGKYKFELVTDQNQERPLLYIQAPDERFFIVEQTGRILLVEDGVTQTEPAFLDLRGTAQMNANEQGLLGLAFHPNYLENGYLFVYYTDAADDTVVSRFEVDLDNPNEVDPATETVFLQLEQPYRNHNGGMIVFGPDDYLYIGLGDGGSGGDPEENGQNLNNLLGALLRIDVDTPGEDTLYSIPSDNPFADGGGLPEIWHYGLRNPWRYSFDSMTGDLYIGDVGQGEFEEISLASAGEGGLNFGWGNYEASQEYGGRPAIDDTVFPIAEYNHGLGCSVTGGYVYHGSALPEFEGVYFYGDYCSGIVWTLQQNEDGEWVNELFLDTDYNISSFAQDAAGELYIVRHDGGVYQLVADED